MLSTIVVLLIVLIGLSILFSVGRNIDSIATSFQSNAKQRTERDILELTAEHQRLKREDPKHPDAMLGQEEFVLAGLKEREKKRSDLTIKNIIYAVFAAALLFTIWSIWDGLNT